MLCVAAAAAALGGACGRGNRSPAIQRLSIATGGTGGVYYVYGGALARALSRRLAGVEATAEVTSASVENLRFVARRSADLAFTLADTAADAARGRGRFEAPLPLRALAVLYPNVTHIVAREEAGIAAVADLRGRRVSLGSPGSGTEVIAERVLRAAGIDPGTDVVRERLGVGESADALRDGRIDAFFWSGGLPTAAVLELASAPRTRIRLLSDAALVDRLVEEHGKLYFTIAVPEGLYPGTAGVRASAVSNLLVAHEQMPEELAYGIVKALFEAKADLAAVHPAARELDAGRAAAGAPLAYHPGAVRYYREVGAWAER
jgi:TRAP transporter TAXI family solute receptor